MIIQWLVYETIVSMTINLFGGSYIPFITFCNQAESYVKIKISEKLQYSYEFQDTYSLQGWTSMIAKLLENYRITYILQDFM